MAQGIKDLMRKQNVPPQVTFSSFCDNRPELGRLPARADFNLSEMIQAEGTPAIFDPYGRAVNRMELLFGASLSTPEFVARMLPQSLSGEPDHMSYSEYKRWRSERGLPR